MTTRKKAIAKAGARAVIYVRVSSESQGTPDRASPSEQERDCRTLAEQKGYVVGEVYRDTERYRVKGRMVEPSGTRADRPGLLRMLAEVDAGGVDVILAFREDRLYRGVNRAMLDLSERVKAGKVTIELAKEHYDASTAPVKGWAAGIELEAKHDRLIMGVANRLRAGKAWNTQPPYGYAMVDGALVPVPEEAEWVVRVWTWYGDGVGVAEIRHRLIAGGAPMKRAGNKYAWPTNRIHRLVRYAPYFSGKTVTEWDGESYEITMPVLVDAATAERVADRRQRYKDYPAGRLGLSTHHAKPQIDLPPNAAGLVYCKACGVRMGAGAGSGRSNSYYYYTCYNYQDSQGCPDCARRVRAPKLDAAIWEKVWGWLKDPVTFEAKLQARIESLQAESALAEADAEGLQAGLDELDMQEQWVITQARTHKINQKAMDTQLLAISIERAGRERELSKARLQTGDRAARLVTLAQTYRAEAVTGFKAINAVADTPERERLQHTARGRLIQGLVMRVDVLADKTPEVHTDLGRLGGIGSGTPEHAQTFGILGRLNVEIVL